MKNNNNNDYQYDSCSARGICSINPRTSSLMEIIFLYLKLTAYYGLKLRECGKDNEKIRKLILNTISVTVSNPNFSENDYKMITANFSEELPNIINEYSELTNKESIVPDFLKTIINIKEPTSIVESIRFGEKEFLNKIKSTPQKILDMYKILFVLAKSICTSMLYLESYGEVSDKPYETILKILDTPKEKEWDAEKLKEFVILCSGIDNELMKELRAVQTKRYGKQREKEVSYTTEKGKPVLVVGSNIRELEYILDSLKDEDIDVYTHDDMILAHTFPEFEKYPNLKGQFGQGVENCLLDFSTFPGPIILTKHSLFNVENLYRGLLYTTDFAYSKGVIPIKNQDMQPVIKAAKEARGFKTGKICPSEKIGFDYENVKSIIDKRIKEENFSGIILFGLTDYEQKDYQEQMLRIVPENIFVISAPCCDEKNNVITLNAASDGYSIGYFADYITKNYNLPLSVIFPKCDRHTLSQIIHMSAWKNVQIFLGKCTPIMLNPTLINTLSELFGILEMSSPKKDLEKFVNNLL